MSIRGKKCIPSRVCRFVALLILAALLCALTACGGSGIGSSGKHPEVDKPAQPQETEAPEETQVFSQPREDGWYVDETGKAYYYLDGAPIAGFFQNPEPGVYESRTFEAGWYYFSSDGVMCADCWVEEQGDSYYFSESGLAAEAGWYCDDRGWYCLGEKGMLYRSIDLSREGSTYCVDENGYLYQVKRHEISCTKETTVIGKGFEVECLIPEEPIERCVELLFCAESSDGKSLSGNSGWILWLKTDGEWQDMGGKFDIVPGMDCFTVRFREPVTFDAFYAKPIVTDASLLSVLADVVIAY